MPKLTNKKIISLVGALLVLLAAMLVNSQPQLLPEQLKIDRVGAKAAAENKLYKVTKVIDGDTIEISTGEKVRLIGINTPEKVDPRRPVQCFGEQASQKTHLLLDGQKVRLVFDIEKHDKYDRTLAYIYREDGLFVNQELVQSGYAFSYPYPPNVKYEDVFVQAQSQAREKKFGLWAGCEVTKTKSGTLQTQNVK